ncbi:hypothetical protein [Diaphorobacter sp. J5-51]|uniref:hypothetical protein n=1 Tax=Diaphorobacter sp. J5-51 TaxID=680496 RepID=UPI0006431D0C|nr:hypothetical protein [Diaphorobacter sp. J5-51]KLR58966.1 hypothetical protein OX89_04025 [Diaphorobacter sp. J5-51]
MADILLSDALRLAINVLRDVAESRKMPSGVAVDQAVAELHADAAETLETSLGGLVEHEKSDPDN